MGFQSVSWGLNKSALPANQPPSQEIAQPITKEKNIVLISELYRVLVGGFVTLVQESSIFQSYKQLGRLDFRIRVTNKQSKILIYSICLA